METVIITVKAELKDLLSSSVEQTLWPVGGAVFPVAVGVPVLDFGIAGVWDAAEAVVPRELSK